MKTKTIDCVECGEKVSYGRLSCPACGALLASVAGGPARQVPESSPVEVDADAPVGVADPADAMPEADAMAEADAMSESDVAPDQIPLPLDDGEPTGAAETQTTETAERGRRERHEGARGRSRG